jgi:hypothetical protein
MIVRAEGKPHRLETTARRKLRHEYVAVTPPEMLKLISDIENHLVKFKNLHADVMAAVATQPRYAAVNISFATASSASRRPASRIMHSRRDHLGRSLWLRSLSRNDPRTALPPLNARRDK